LDWFKTLVGFQEQTYDKTRSKLQVVDGRLISKVNGASFRTGRLELLSLGQLREKGRTSAPTGRLKVSEVAEDVRLAHRDRTNHGALFQVASQFNLLEMADPSVAPEDGVTCYQYDNTQGPACAIAAGAATIFRNYFVPIGDAMGQSARQQINTLDTFGKQLADAIGLPPEILWTMKNGYALPNENALKKISEYLSS